MKNNLSHYQPLPFHAVRAFSLITSGIVTGIMIYFCYHLKHEGFKIPWTFLIVLAASILTLVALILTTVIHCCGRLSPVFSLVLNIPLLLIWIIGMSVLAWNIYGTLSHSCSIANWGNSRGVSVCSTYKALFAFIIFGLLAHIAQVVLDVRARRHQTRSGKYSKMTPVVNDFKSEPYYGGDNSNVASSHPLVPTTHDDIPGWRPQTAYTDSNHSDWRPQPAHTDSHHSDWRPQPAHTDSHNSDWRSQPAYTDSNNSGWRPQPAYTDSNNYYANRY